MEAIQPVGRVDPMAAQYIYNAAGIDGLNSMYGSQIRPLSWQVRYFKPLQKEEYRVAVDPGDGQVVAFQRLLPETAGSADLELAGAREISASFLRGHGYDLRQFDLKETRSERPRQRRDSSFVWEAREGTQGAIGGARLRLETGVLGDKIGLWSQYVKIPEEWQRNRERQSFYSIAIIGIRAAFFVALACLAIMSLIRGIRRGLIRWNLAVKIASGAVLLELISLINSYPKLMFQYDTQMEMRVYVLSSLVGGVLMLIGIGLAAAFAAATIMSCFPDTPALFRRENRMIWGRDAVVASMATLGVVMAMQWVASQIDYRATRLALVPGIALPDSMGTCVPLLANVRDALLSALFFSAVAAFSVDLWLRSARRPLFRIPLLAGLLVSFLPLSARRVSEAAMDAIPAVLFVLFAVALIVCFLRSNYLAYVVSAGILSLARASSFLIEQGNMWLAIQGWLFCALGLAGVTWLWRQGNFRTPDMSQ
jgi:hypothetical protein